MEEERDEILKATPALQEYPLLIPNQDENGKVVLASPSLAELPPPNFQNSPCSKENIKCIECNGNTPYVFKLLPSPVRLCERCEHAGSKYMLVTELEAKGHYLLDDEDLCGLPFKEVKIKKSCVYFFLRASVEKLALAKCVHFEGGDHCGKGKHKENIGNAVDASCSKPNVEWDEAYEDHSGSSRESENDSLPDDTLAEDISNMVGLAEVANSITCLHGSAEGSQDMLVQTLENGEHALDRGEKKAIRKEHKRQVKAENRKRRMQRKLKKQLRQKLGKYAPRWKLSHAKRSGKNESSACTPIPRAMRTELGDMLVEVQNADDKPTLRHKHRKNKRVYAASSNMGYQQKLFLEYNYQSKIPTEWVKEREWLEAELGKGGISALELASFE